MASALAREAPALLRRCRAPSLGQGPLAQHWVQLRAATFGQRDFFQRINEQHLAHELKKLSDPGHLRAEGAASEQTLFDPKVRMRHSRRLVPSAAFSADEGGNERAGDSKLDAQGAFEQTRRWKPWLQYESLRGATYPSFSSSSRSRPSSGAGDREREEARPGPRWRDLTHSEAQRLQEMYMRKRMLDRKLLWMKQQDLPNPEREAKMTLRRQKRQEEEAKASADIGGTMFPPPFLDTHPGSGWMTRQEESARREELESAFRSRIRKQKLENAKILKGAAPRIGDLVTDPIERHVQRRLLRQRTKIHAGIEEALTRNTAQILFEFLRGVAISVVRVRAKRPRATQEIHYSLTSDHDPVWVQKQLDTLAPKLRSQLALRVNMGQTPNIRFVPAVRAQDIQRDHLWGMAQELQAAIPVGGLPASGSPSPVSGKEV